MAKLSDLKSGSSPAKEIRAEQIPALIKLGTEFFGDADRILTDEPGNTPELRYIAMSRFAMFMENIQIAQFPFVGNTCCTEPGVLEYRYRRSRGGTCYDGGCYSSEPDEDLYFALSRITDAEYEEKQAEKEQKPNFYYWSYKANLYAEDRTEVFIDKEYNLYFKDPMGISGCFVIKREYR